MSARLTFPNFRQQVSGPGLLRQHVLAAFLLLSACAPAPERIAPAPVYPSRYAGWTCERLGGEEARLNHTLAGLYAEQSQSRTDDAVGYLFLLLPLASMSAGDLQHQIALLKGEKQAVRSALDRRCRIIQSEMRSDPSPLYAASIVGGQI